MLKLKRPLSTPVIVTAIGVQVALWLLVLHFDFGMADSPAWLKLLNVLQSCLLTQTLITVLPKRKSFVIPPLKHPDKDEMAEKQERAVRGA